MMSFSGMYPSILTFCWPRLLASACGLLLLLGLGKAPDSRAQEAPLRPVADSPQTSGTTFWVDLSVGTDAQPVSDLFGTSFVMEYDASRAVVVADSAGGFLGSEIVYQSNVDPAAGEVGIGVSRTDGTGTDGHGVVARVKVRIPDSTEGGASLPFSVSDVTTTSPNGDTLQVSSGDLTVEVVPAPPIRPAPPTSVAAGNSFWVDLTVGTDAIPVDQLFGTSASLSYDPDRLSVVADSAGPFLGSDVVYQSNVDSATGEIGLGVSRKAGTGAVSGHGVVARVKLRAKETAAGTSVPLEIPVVSATDSEGNSVHLNPESQTVDVDIPSENRTLLRPTASAQAGAQDAFWVDVTVGTESAPAENLFGTSFTLNYDASRVSVVDDEAGAFLGADLVYQSNVDSAAGEVGVGVSRKAGAGGVSGSGTVARIRVSVADTVSEGTTLPFRVDEMSVNRPEGESVPTKTDPLIVSIPISESALVGDEGTVEFGDTGSAIDFSGVSGEDTVTVERFNDEPADTSGIAEENVSDTRLILEAGDGLSFSSSEVRLAVGDIVGIDDPTQVTIYRRSEAGTGTFEDLETRVDDNGTPEIEDDTLFATTDSFSEFTLASDSEPLPVEMAGFDATIDAGDVRLTWATASETNNAGFRIQRRVVDVRAFGMGNNDDRKGRGDTWTTVGFVEGAGTTSQAQRYRFTDADLPYEANRVQYRLKQVDTDGSAHFSVPIAVRRSASRVQFLAPYPNPAQSRTTVRYALPETQNVTLRLYDLLGRQIQTVVEGEQGGRHRRRVDLSEVSSGTYFLRLRAGGATETRKLTIVK